MTATSLWHDLAILAGRPGGWVLPLLALFLFYLAVWALLDMSGHEDAKRQPPLDLPDEQARKAAADAAFRATAPPFTPATGPKGARPGFTRDHHASVLQMGARRNGDHR